MTYVDNERKPGLDWSALNLDGDPVPGDCGDVSLLADRYADRSVTCSQIEHVLEEAISDRVSFKGKSAIAMHNAIQDSIGIVHKLAQAFEGASKAMQTWAYALQEFQQTADSLCQQAMEKRSTIGKTQQLLNDARTSYSQMMSQEDAAYDDLANASSLVNRYNGDLTDLNDDVRSLTYQVQDCEDEYHSKGKDLSGDIETHLSTLQEISNGLTQVQHFRTCIGVFEATGHTSLAIGKRAFKNANVVTGQKILGKMERYTGNLEIPMKVPKHISKWRQVVRGGIKGSIVGSLLDGALDGAQTYSERDEQYGADTARQDAWWHFGISTVAGVVGGTVSVLATGAAAGAVAGSVVPGLGTVVGAAAGAIAGLAVGSVISSAGDAFYDSVVGRGEGDGFWDKLGNNLKFW
ncbi:hypothetical protein ACLUWO_04880 [Pseudoscardovia radai]|uniref:hypothetical protein n=1 Tax=Pseudoscardovia radai TaxID=987066 RepID=UPI003994CF80